MIYRIAHTTVYEYRDPVALSHHILRLKPRELSGQNCLDHEITISPGPNSVEEHRDYFGNAVSVICIEQPHTRLEFKSESRVRRAPSRALDPIETPSWEKVRDLSRGAQIGAALEASEFLYDSPLVKADDEFAEFASRCFTKSRPILDAIMELTSKIHDELIFDPEATTVSTPVKEVLRKQRGVCQDFAHLQIACLRSLGLSARYVSGYIETLPPPGQEKMIGCDASHAWVSFYCPGLGWIDVDPTNNLLVSQQHVTLSWGRDYSDISPVRGVILGSGDHTVSVSVDVRPVKSEADAANSE
jgi:transglutaminase-like putative cysteine protease